jgi:putative metalloenzyme radical SAM/SPASM domain maturase
MLIRKENEVLVKSSAAMTEEILAAPALREYPSKLFVETTTRCNLSCAMCMKQAGGGLREGDLSQELFAALEPAFPNLESLVLNGIGEPLLHDRLEQFIGRAKSLMPAGSWVGFQSNGLLMTEMRAVSLVEAGLDRVCLSVDSVSPDTFRTVREGGELGDVEHALSALATARKIASRPDLRVGVEFVAMRSNFRELPAAIEWAASRGVDFAIVSHLVPFDGAQAGESLFGTCTDAALSLFHTWDVKAKIAGVDLRSYFDLLWKYSRSHDEQRVVNYVEAIKADGRRRGIMLDMRKLLDTDWKAIQEVAVVFHEAAETAQRVGVELTLPEPVPLQERRCGFVENGGAFVSWDGDVHPCHFLWHGCRSSANGWDQTVKPRTFGSLRESGILDIWNGAEFRTFRENVLRYDYPVCSSCSLAPCDYIEGDDFSGDCYVNAEPCGSCLWSMGLFHCLT